MSSGSKLEWTTDRVAKFKGLRVPVGAGLTLAHDARAGTMQFAGIRPNTRAQVWAKSAAYLLRALTFRGPRGSYIHDALGELVRQGTTRADTFLDVGAGAMQMEPFVPEGVAYNAADIAWSEFQLRRALARPARFNVALASITALPIADDRVTAVIAAEMLAQVPPIGEALAELRRVLAPGGKLFASFANARQPKYRKLGGNPNQVHPWDRAAFAQVAADAGFELEKFVSIGTWDETTNTQRGGPAASEADATHYVCALRSTK